MKFVFLSVIALFLSLSLVACSKDTSADQTPEQKKATAEFSSQFESLKKQAEKTIADAKEKADAEGKKALESVETAIAGTESALKDLQTSGGKVWDEKKPVLEAALKDLGTKITDALAKTKLGGIKLPGFGK